VGDVQGWSATDDSNTDLFPENMPFGDVNDSGRAIQGAMARWFMDWNGSIVASGSSNAYSITSNRTIGSLANNTLMWFRANHTNTGAATLNLNGLGAKDIVRATGSALTAGDITSGQIVGVYYNSTLDDWVLITPAVQGSASDTASGLIELAVQSEMEAAADVARAVVPGRQHFHPGMPKAWVAFSTDGTVLASHNVTDVTQNGNGDYTVNLAITMSSVNYCVLATPNHATPTDAYVGTVFARTATTVRIKFVQESGVAVAMEGGNVVIFGDL
jgi:hypothetical protein